MHRVSISDLACDLDQGHDLKKVSALYTDEQGKSIELYFYKSVVTADDDELILYAAKEPDK